MTSEELLQIVNDEFGDNEEGKAKFAAFIKGAHATMNLNIEKQKLAALKLQNKATKDGLDAAVTDQENVVIGLEKALVAAAS